MIKGELMRKNILGVLLLVMILTGCSNGKQKDIRGLIDKGDYSSAQKILKVRLNTEAESGMNWLLLAETYRRDYFPTYRAAEFSTPLGDKWQYFPSKKFELYPEYLQAVEKAHEAGYSQQSPDEYYFIVCYNFNRWKYFGENNVDMETYLDYLIEFKNDWSDNAGFWKKYIEAGRTINFDWTSLNDLWEKYPDTELIPLGILPQFLGVNSKQAKLKLNPYTVERMRHFQQKYPEFAIFADSLFIYKELAPLVSYHKSHASGSKRNSRMKLTAFLDEVTDEMISSRINLWCIWEKGQILIAENRINEGFTILESVISKELNKYNKDKLNGIYADLAYRNEEYSRVIRSYRQLTNLGFRDKMIMWEAYLAMNHESEADKLYPQLLENANNKQKQNMIKIQYDFDLSNLEVNDLNLVQTADRVTVAGKLINTTYKKYEDVVIELTVMNTEKSESLLHTINVIYPETNSSFNVFIDFSSISQELSVTGKVTGFKRAK
jgi:hypothetical protein